MTKLSLSECKEISLDILLKVASFCDKNNLKYYIMGGTLLGAVRHGGFIPWDDDIDIMMPRPDYEVFISSFEDDRYKVFKSTEGRYSYSKVYDTKTIKYEDNMDNRVFKPLGVDIDIFVLDGIVNDEKEMLKIYKKIVFLEKLLHLSTQPFFYRKSLIKAFYRIIARIISGKRIVKAMEKLEQTYNYNDCEYIIRMRSSPNGFTGILPKSDYDDAVELKFEQYYFKAPKEYKKWLTIYYGDYMKIPPEEKRVPHLSECYWRSNG